MVLYGLWRGREPVGDLRVTQTISQQQQDLKLARGEAVWILPRCRTRTTRKTAYARKTQLPSRTRSVAGRAPSRSKIARARRWAGSSPSISAIACSYGQSTRSQRRAAAPQSYLT